MALRKFKKLMVPLSVIFIAMTLIPIFVETISRLNDRKKLDNVNEVIAEVNGHKIHKIDYEREVEAIKQNIGQVKAMKAQQGMEDNSEVPDDVIRRVALNDLVSKVLLISSAEDLKIKVNEKDVNDQVSEMRAAMPKGTSFLSYLQSVGILNEKELKRLIRESIQIRTLLETQQKAYKIPDEELKKYYELYKFTDFQDQTFEEAKIAIEDSVGKEYLDLIKNSLIEKQRTKAKIVFHDDNIKKLYEDSDKPIAEKDGYKFRSEMLDTRVLTMIFSRGVEYDANLVGMLKEGLTNDLDNLVAIGNAAKEKGLKASPEFIGTDELRDLGKKYFFYLIDAYKPADEELKKVYDASGDKYDIKHTVGGYVVGGFSEPTEEDKQAAKKKAEDLAKTLNAGNFSEIAKKESDDPGSKDAGGELGWIDSNTNFVPVFLEAVKNAKKGEIVGPVESDFGYHIIYIEDREENNPDRSKVSHILIMPKASEGSKKALIEKLQALKKDLQENKVTWADIIDQDKYQYEVKEVFKKITENSAVPGIGFEQEANNKLFTSKVNEILEYSISDGYFLMVKTSETPFRKRTFEEVKEQIRIEEALKYATAEIDKLK